MKIYFNTQIKTDKTVYKQNTLQTNPFAKDTVSKNGNTIIFGAAHTPKTITSQIANEKSKLLRQIKNILETDIPFFTEEERIAALIAQAHRHFENKERREQEIEFELRMIASGNTNMNDQQKYDRAQQLWKEHNNLKKYKLVENLPQRKNEIEYDYSLVSKFKSAILEDNFNLAEIFKEHYSELNEIQNLEELSEKFPAIKAPQDIKVIMAKKFLDNMPRIFYEEMDKLMRAQNRDEIMSFYKECVTPLFRILSDRCGISVKDLYEKFGQNIVIEMYRSMINMQDKYGNFNSIPEIKRNPLANVNNDDIALLPIDYNKFILYVLKEMYLENKKPNEIVYNDGEHKIKVSSLKAPNYKFEKVSEKIKSLIAIAEKIKVLQKKYQDYTPDELLNKLNFYAYEEIGNNEKIFNLIVAFSSCKFTEEDKQYLIKFLQILDKIQEKEITLQEGLEEIENYHIKPHGTNKLNEIERKQLEEKLKEEQHRNLELLDIRHEFDNALNSLYTKKLVSVAETCSKYYPEEYNEENVKNAKFIINLIKESLKENNPVLIQNKIMRFEIYNKYTKNNPNSTVFENSLKYAKDFPDSEKIDRSGQYLLKYQIIKNYPESRDMALNSEILDKIIELCEEDKELATTYLCKYEDYYLLEKTSKGSIYNILNIFDEKNNNDRILIKNIIENDYINLETVAYNNLHRENEDIQIKIMPSAKKAIMEKYKFPKCIDLFCAFEDAIKTTARSKGSSGIKQTGTNNETLAYKMEVKINGYPDRLFSSGNNFIFDIYSEEGLH